jgi:aspartate kinase
MLVMKFGGSSVADANQIEKVCSIVRGRLARSPVVVASAHKGVTNGLIAAGRAAAAGEANAGAAIVARQKAIARGAGAADDVLAPFYQELDDLLRGVRLVKELSPRSLDYVASFGERMSVRVIADYFSRHALSARAYDVWDLGFVTDSTFGQARPLEGYEERMRAAFARDVPAGVVPVVTGFVGKNEAGDVTTVGRNGSDLTATLVAAAIGAEEVEIWSDTDGVMTADPALVRTAQSIAAMSFDEAAELAYFGSRVLHPETLIPAMKRSIPVRVLNTNRPDHPGTVIERVGGGRGAGVTSIAYKEGQSILTVRSPRMFAHSGFLARIFETAARHGVVVDLVATSEISVSLSGVEQEPLRRVADELGGLGECRVVTGKTILAIVGHPLPARAGIGATVLGALAREGVNVEMISYGQESINFSIVIADADVSRAVPALHATLFE